MQGLLIPKNGNMCAEEQKCPSCESQKFSVEGDLNNKF